MPQPWYHEASQGALWNEWTWTHLAWGAAAYRLLGNHLTGLLLHTVYEAVEGELFPRPHRDTSMRNHLGDTLAFVAGSLAAAEFR